MASNFCRFYKSFSLKKNQSLFLHALGASVVGNSDVVETTNVETETETQLFFRDQDRDRDRKISRPKVRDRDQK